MEFILSKINIISGKKDVGKSFLCSNLVDELKNRDYSIAGISSPGKYVNNKKVGIFATNISNGDMIELATFSPGWDPENLRREWKINYDAIPWGNEVLKNINPCDVLIVDEIGFLELEKESGWSRVFQIVNECIFKISFIVVRPELLSPALSRWENANVIRIKDKDQSEAALASILDQVEIILAR
jgi:nucleoside-triphosphatase THEP1